MKALSIRLRVPFENIGQSYRHGDLRVLPSASGKSPGLAWRVTRTVRSSGFTSLQNRYITSCSRNPVNKNVENRVALPGIAGDQKLGQFLLSVFAGKRRDSFGQVAPAA